MKPTEDPSMRGTRRPAAPRTASVERLLARAIRQSRAFVLAGIGGVLLVAIALFALSTYIAVISVWDAAYGVATDGLTSTDLKVLFLQVVTLMLKAVAFYIIGVGLYTLYIAPLRVRGLNVDSATDLEAQIVNVIIVIMAVTFLQQLAEGGDADALLRTGVALALVILALVAFQLVILRMEAAHGHTPDGPTAPDAAEDRAAGTEPAGSSTQPAELAIGDERRPWSDGHIT
jgi:uncharacterized membrane protein YqhA